MSRFTAVASCLVSFFGIASLQLWAATSARADAIYEYTGNPFTFAPPWLRFAQPVPPRRSQGGWLLSSTQCAVHPRRGQGNPEPSPSHPGS